MTRVTPYLSYTSYCRCTNTISAMLPMLRSLLPVSKLVHRLVLRLFIYRLGRKKQTYMLYIDRTIAQFLKRLTSIIALKDGDVKHYVQGFNITAIHCNDRGKSFPKLSDCSIYAKHVCSTFYTPPSNVSEGVLLPRQVSELTLTDTGALANIWCCSSAMNPFFMRTTSAISQGVWFSPK